MRLPNLVLGCVLAGACSGGDGSSAATSPLGAEEREEVCSTYCAHQLECGAGERVACTTWCDGLASLIRADAARALLACWTDVACDGLGEALCLGDVIDSTEPTAVYDATRASCHATEARCLVSYACAETYFVLLSDETLRALDGCFGLACEAVDGCVLETFGGG